MAGPTRSRLLSVCVNGQPRQVSAGTLADLLEEMGYPSGRKGIAVALNGEVVPRGRWHEKGLSDGDAVEIVGAVQGG